MPKCPNCQRKLSISSVRPQFSCPSCKKALASNITAALVICVVGWSLFVPFAANAIAPAMCGKSGWCFGLADTVVGSLIFFPLFLVLLRVRIGDPLASPPG